jgi:glycosyltransferase involved in cell wall biosynthesis
MKPEDLPHPRAAARPKILFVTYISPLQKWGSAHRSRLLIDALGRHGKVQVLALSFGASAAEHGHTREDRLGTTPVIDLKIHSRGIARAPRFDVVSSELTREVGRHVDLDGYDLIVSRYVRPAMKLALPAGVPVIVDFDDALYEPPWAALKGPKQWAGVLLRLLNDRVLTRARLRLPPHSARHYFFCRQAEKDAFPALRGSVLPNVPPRPARQGVPDFTAPAAPALMFIGLLDYMPNEDAVDWFLGRVWPRVRQAVPGARFMLAGTASDDRRARWARVEGVDVLGFVDDLVATYGRATASIVPMRCGAGTNVKALEALLYGRPVIATPRVLSGYRGIVELDDVVLTADQPEAFARHCIDLLRHPARAADLARRGHARIDTRLDGSLFSSIVDQAVRQVLAPRSDCRGAD